MSEIMITQNNFEELINSEKTILLDFYADWCVPCKMLGPVISEVALEQQDVIVGKVDIEKEMELAQTYHVASIPTLVVMKKGELHKRVNGFHSKNQILELIK